MFDFVLPILYNTPGAAVVAAACSSSLQPARWWSLETANRYPNGCHIAHVWSAEQPNFVVCNLSKRRAVRERVRRHYRLLLLQGSPAAFAAAFASASER